VPLTMYNANKNSIDKIINKYLNSGSEEADEFKEMAKAMFEHSSQDLFIQMRYTLLQQDNTEHLDKLISVAIEIFELLYTEEKTAEQKQFLLRSLREFIANTSIRFYNDRSRIFKRREVVNQVLQHMTNYLNEILDTQKLTIANISHEMRTSLNTILGYIIQLNQHSNLSGTDKQYLNKAKEASTTLLGLVNEILDVTKINAGELEIKISNFWIDDLFSEILNSISELEKQHSKISFTYSFDFFAYEILGDKSRISSIILNLINNAFKYTSKGSIHLSVTKTVLKNNRLEILFIVKDTGSGMSKEQLESIFKPFVRHNNEEQGVGLGLFIAQKLAKNMNGSLEVASKVGIGSEFTFSITVDQQIKHYPCIKGAKLLFFLEQGTDEQYELYTKMSDFFRSKGADVKLIDSELEFISLTTIDPDNNIDIISISAPQHKYKKHSALVNYLKQSTHFTDTLFVASFATQHSDLDDFDQIFRVLPTLGAITRRLLAKRVTLNKYTNDDNSNTLKILAIDDIETNLEVLELFIKNRYSNAMVDKATGGYETIGMCKVKEYDLILMDLKMPGMSGYDLFLELRKQGNTSTIYALTADVYEETIRRVKHTGFDGLLEKPIQVDVLYEIIEGVNNAAVN